MSQLLEILGAPFFAVVDVALATPLAAVGTVAVVWIAVAMLLATA
jgi:hypothetical protein